MLIFLLFHIGFEGFILKVWFLRKGEVHHRGFDFSLEIRGERNFQQIFRFSSHASVKLRFEIGANISKNEFMGNWIIYFIFWGLDLFPKLKHLITVFNECLLICCFLQVHYSTFEADALCLWKSGLDNASVSLLKLRHVKWIHCWKTWFNRGHISWR